MKETDETVGVLPCVGIAIGHNPGQAGGVTVVLVTPIGLRLGFEFDTSQDIRDFAKALTEAADNHDRSIN